MKTALAMLALMFAQVVPKPPVPEPGTNGAGNADMQYVQTAPSLVFSNNDEHGCNRMFSWDEGKGICSIHITFQPDMGVVTCSLVGADPDKTQHMVCWYKPVMDFTTPLPLPALDVPPITETYWMEMFTTCMDECPAPPRISLTQPKDGAWRQYTRSTCADKTRFLMAAEDGSKHCIALKEKP